MLKIYNGEVVKPLSLIFKNCVQCGAVPKFWKKSNTALVQKKEK